MGLCLEPTNRAQVYNASSVGLFFDPFERSLRRRQRRCIAKADNNNEDLVVDPYDDDDDHDHDHANVMNQFRIHHDVNQLFQIFGLQSEEGLTPDYVEMLLKNKVPHSTTQVGSHIAAKRLAEQSSSPQEFLALYEKLQGKNVRDLPAVLSLLLKISEDSQVKHFVEKNWQQKAATVSEKDDDEVSGFVGPIKILSNELDQLRDMLLKERYPAEGLAEKRHVADADAKKNASSCIPTLPAWTCERSYLTLDFVPSGEHVSLGGSIGCLPIAAQEHYLLEDVLSCFSGIEGTYVSVQASNDSKSGYRFIVDETIDPCLKEMIWRLLPICSNYSIVVRFMKEKSAFEYGLVNHALCGAIRSLIKDYLLLIAQLEFQLHHGVLTFQKLWFYLQPTKQTLELLVTVAVGISKSNSKGGSVLNLLYDTMANLSGDVKAQDLCLFLIQNACVPYFEILERWIYKGVISDLYEEFLVEDNELIQKEELPIDYSNDYWEKRYTICYNRVPGFLEKVADMILRTGKYLNVIRQCGKDIHCPCAEEIVFTNKECDYVACIEKAYDFASRKLLDLLLEETDLMGHLRSVKHYFLLDQGDFIVQFMDMAEDELKKNIDDIMPTRLESLLGLALRMSVANSDPYNDDVRTELLPYDLMTQMLKILSIETKEEKNYQLSAELNLLGLEAFSFDYEVKWPLSLVLNRKALACYQMLFRHLFYAKHVERLLCNVWISNRVAKSFPLTDARLYGAAFALRQRMLNFVQNLQYYMMFEVLEPNWNIFLGKMQMISNVDEVLDCHMEFLNICLKDCMLTSPHLLKMTNQLMTICIRFCTFVQKMSRYSLEAELTGMAPSLAVHAETEEQEVPDSEVLALAKGESYEQRIDHFDEEFTNTLITLLDRISDIGQVNYNDKLVNVLYRLDFNGFYTPKLESLVLKRSMMTETLSELQL